MTKLYDKRLYIPLAAVLVAMQAAAQTPGGVPSPLAWSATHRADSIKIDGGSGFTFVGISKADKNRERTIWSMTDGTASELVQTTSRTADLKGGSFMNCNTDSAGQMRLYSYSASRNVGGKTLLLGKSSSVKLPSDDMTDALVEYAVYNRSLSSRERAQVESFMALKHGITLKSSYYDSHGRVIWNAFKNKKYRNRISGIAADSASAQHIQSAMSAEDGAFVRISTDKISDGQSLLFGDDGGNLSLARSSAFGKWMGRRWKAASAGMAETEVRLTANASAIRQIAPLAEGESYYLAIDTTGTGTFSPEAVVYRKADFSGGDTIAFCGVKAYGNSVFTLRAEKDLFTTIDVEQPSGQGETGTLSLLVTGGLPPFSMKLEKDDKPAAQKNGNESRARFENLAEGRYTLTTTDRTGNSAVNEFRISSDGITEILPELAGEGGIVRNIVASPNPTTDGNVGVQIELSSPSAVSLSLCTTKGAAVSTLSLGADTYFSKQLFLPERGHYLLSIKIGDYTKTVKLIRK